MPRPKLHLKFKGITPRTSRAYRKEIERFFSYLSAEAEELPGTCAELDFLLSEYVNVLYQEGDSITQAGWLLSGIKRFLPRVRYRLPTAQQYYQNWLRDHVPQRAVPMPWLVAKALSAAAWKAGHFDLSVTLLLGFCFFLRTMEFITLRRENVVVDLESSQVVITLERTKTSRQFQQSLVLRHRPLAQNLPQAFTRLPQHGRLWASSAAVFRRCFCHLLRYFNLETYNFSLYSIRRGGATQVYVASRDIHFVTMQGRWKDIRTSRIYLDDARATLVRLSFPPPTAHRLQSFASWWTSFS